jgi:hypothetical protein
MRWEGFFDDLEAQLASEWEAERAALDTEAERLRLSRVGLRDRLSRLNSHEPVPASFDLSDGSVLRATVTGVGADCLALLPLEGRPAPVVAPLASLTGVSVPPRDLLHTALPESALPPTRRPLAERLTFGFVLRDLARRRVGVALHLVSGRALAGTIDRAGADHLDLAIHDPGAARRADSVTGYRVVPFAAVSWVRIDGSSSVL